MTTLKCLRCTNSNQILCSSLKLPMKCPGNLLRRKVTACNKLREVYDRAKKTFEKTNVYYEVNPDAVFACNQLNLADVNVYGFDYDYTLAHYKPSLQHLLYYLGRELLLERYKYPCGICELEYNHKFAIRGLHYDIDRGLLMKLDSYLQLQMGAVYRGLTPVSDEEVFKTYKARTIPIHDVEGHLSDFNPNRSKMAHLADLFSVPQMGLLCNVAEYFYKNNIEFNPEILFLDVKNSIGTSHPIMHKIVAKNVQEYIRPNEKLKEFFEVLKSNNKKVFLLTNSPFFFVNAGMTMLMGPNWRDYFDILIVDAKKPKFFTDTSRPIRMFDKKANTQIWEKITKLEKGIVYYEGTVKQLQDMTGFHGYQVLYFGDHPYSDLADATLERGWRTGAIIHELTREINTFNEKSFKDKSGWLDLLTRLIEEHHNCQDPEALKVIAEWNAERDKLRKEVKVVFNPQFGSMFRTYHNPTYFSRRLFRFADIYMSNITNLLNYSISHSFHPRRGIMPHEYGTLRKE